MPNRALPACDTASMQSPLKAPTASTDPKSVKVNLTAGTGVEIEWRDGHLSAYTFPFLRDACPCATCNEEREKTGRKRGEPPKPAAGALAMVKATGRAHPRKGGSK